MIMNAKHALGPMGRLALVGEGVVAFLLILIPLFINMEGDKAKKIGLVLILYLATVLFTTFLVSPYWREKYMRSRQWIKMVIPFYWISLEVILALAFYHWLSPLVFFSVVFFPSLFISSLITYKLLNLNKVGQSEISTKVG